MPSQQQPAGVHRDSSAKQPQQQQRQPPPSAPQHQQQADMAGPDPAGRRRGSGGVPSSRGPRAELTPASPQQQQQRRHPPHSEASAHSARSGASEATGFASGWDGGGEAEVSSAAARPQPRSAGPGSLAASPAKGLAADDRAAHNPQALQQSLRALHGHGRPQAAQGAPTRPAHPGQPASGAHRAPLLCLVFIRLH